MTIGRDGKVEYKKEGTGCALAQVASVFVIPFFLLIAVAFLISKCN